MSEAFPSPTTPDFDKQKQEYFWKLGVHLKSAMRSHKDQGLLEKTPEGKRDWGNVTEHCLVEAARAREFGEILGFAPDLAEDMITAAAIHDMFKLNEKKIVSARGLGWDAFEEVNRQLVKVMRESGYSDRVIWFAGAVGHGSLLDTQSIMEQTDLSPDEEAFLVMHYIDDYTVGSDWAEPPKEIDGKRISNFDVRMDMNEANERYNKLDQDGRTLFEGRSTFEVQRELGHAVEDRLASMVSERTHTSITPDMLPVFIDDQVRQRITHPLQTAA